ncbi:MAG: FAD-dependent oxidoreductase, partial [Planctomycetota bacterium]
MFDHFFWCAALVAMASASALAGGRVVLAEAEAFDETGGWVVDQQFMDQMGSPYLLAHGLGEPVEDATTTVTFPAAGAYRVWVRTMDWVARWDAPGQPGRFQVVIDRTPLATTFGTKGAEWFWQDGGAVTIPKKQATVALHDLTGFEGRCDAICFASDPEFRPPDALKPMTAWRRELGAVSPEPQDAGSFDLVVVGGGIAGTCAALSAARLGLSVALIQDRPVLGGNNSSEVRVWLGGARNKRPYPHVGDIVRELEQERRAHYGPSNTADLYEDERKLALVRDEENITLFLLHRGNAVEHEGGRITAVIAQHVKTGVRRRVAGRWFADCTGDGCIGFLAGADYEMTEEGHMGRCNLWNVIETDQPQPFARCPWALDLTDKPFPGRGDDRRGTKALGGWYWESGFDHNPFEKSEYIRDWNFRAAYGAWDALKNVDKVYPNHKLNWMAYIAGKRESRRLMGDVVLSQKDLVSGKEYPDGCVPTGWHIDLHLPHPRYVEGFEGDAFISRVVGAPRYRKPYWVPYRCLYSRNVPNLFMAGRDISVTHQALGATRVMRTCGCMGEVVGRAAYVCKTNGCDPRGVYARHLDQFKALLDRPLHKPRPRHDPDWVKAAGENLARAAAVSVAGSRDAESHPPSLINDGEVDTTINDLRWLSAAEVPHWV